MKKWLFWIIFLLIIITTLIFQYNFNYKIRILPPSDKWSKEVEVSSAKLRTYPKMLEFNENIIIAHQDGETIKVIKLDSKGQKIKEKVIPGEDTFVKYINLLKDEKYLYVNWIIRKGDVSSLINITLDNDLNIVNRQITDNPLESIQIGDSTLVLAYNNKIEIEDMITKKKVIKNVNSPSMLAGTVRNGENFIAYWEKEKEFKYFREKDGITSDIKLAGAITVIQQRDTIKRAVLGTDGKFGYIFLEIESRNSGFGVARLLTFQLDKNGSSHRDFRLQGYGKYIYNMVSIPSNDGARFMAACERKIGKKNFYKNIVEFNMKDKEVSDLSFVSRTFEPSMYPGANKDMAVFCSYGSNDIMHIYIASKDQALIDIFNKPRAFERKIAIMDTIEGMINGVCNIFILGLGWIIPALIASVIMSFIACRTNKNKIKLIAFSIGYLISAISIMYVIHDICFVINPGILPGILGNVFFSMLLILLLSSYSFVYGYEKYKKRIIVTGESIPVFDFLPSLFVNSILVLLIFTPFLP